MRGKTWLTAFTACLLIHWNPSYACVKCFPSGNWITTDSIVGLCVYFSAYINYVGPHLCTVDISWGDGTDTTLTGIPPRDTFSFFHCYPNACDTFIIHLFADCYCDTCSIWDTIPVNVGATIQALPSNQTCLGDSLTLSASPSSPQYTYNWYLPNDTLLDTSATIGFRPGTPGIVSVTLIVWDSLSQCGDTETVPITVYLPSSFNLPDSVEKCWGDTVTLGPPVFSIGFPPFSFNWTPAAGLSCTSCPAPNHVSNTPGSYILTVTDAHGCQSRDTTHVVIRPSPTITATGDSVCAGDTAWLSASATGGTPPYTYQWTPSATLTCSNCPNPGAFPISTTTYTITVTDANNCQQTDSVLVLVYPLPMFTLPDTVEKCLGDKVPLGPPNFIGGASTPPYTYQWTPPSGLTCTNCSSPLHNGSTSQTYTLIVTDANNCQWQDSTHVLVHPVPTLTAIGDSICLGDTAWLSASTTGGTPPYTYQWTPSATLTCSNCPNPGAFPTTTTTYTITVTDVNNCQHTDSILVLVYPLPTFTLPDSIEKCFGDTVTLGPPNFTGAAGTPPYTYQWTPPTNLSCTNCPAPTHTGTTSQIYTLIVTDANNCQWQDTLELTVLPLPVAQARGDSICAGEQASLTVQTTSGTPPYTYQWTPDGPVACPTCPSTTASPSSTQTFIIHVTDAKGCQTSDTTMVIVYPKPELTASTSNICLGDTTLLTSTTSSGTPPYTYQWIPATYLACDTCPSTQANPPDTTTYTLIVTDAYGCRDTASTTVIVYPLPVFSLRDTILCWHDSIYITIPVGVAWQWTPTVGVACPTCQSTIVRPHDTTTYSVTATSIHGCTYTEQFTIFVDQGAPTQILQDTTAYSGSEIVLLGITTVPTYWWSSPNGEFLNIIGTRATVLVPAPGETSIFYFWTQTDNGCLRWDSAIVQGIEYPSCENNDWIPNAFSPNGDGLNDVLYIYAIRPVLIREWRIYNRWGELVFEAQNIRAGLPYPHSEVGWDGTYQGKPLPSDVYVYYYEVQCGRIRYMRTGDITIFR